MQGEVPVELAQKETLHDTLCGYDARFLMLAARIRNERLVPVELAHEKGIRCMMCYADGMRND